MPAVIASRVQIGVFKLDLGAGELRRDGRGVVLQDQPFRVLRMLVASPGKLVTRDEIRKELWPNDTVVGFDQSINTVIRKLREAFCDSAERPKYIETVARRGYRLIVPVKWLESSPASPSMPRVTPVANLIGQKVSHYRVLEVLGGGGMGVVYKAEDLKLGRRVALKFLPEELAGDPGALERFEREARAASALEHPNICPVYEFGEHQGQPFIGMQLLSGQTLRDLIATPLTPYASPLGREPVLSEAKEWPEGPGEGARSAMLPIKRVLDIAIQIADGLEAAHSQGIIHRDIKPANIFITTRGEVKILDFGLAKLVDLSEDGPKRGPEGDGHEAGPQQGSGAPTLSSKHLTLTGTAMGTASYMSPEQIRGEKLDQRTDLFSLGTVLYQMATGRPAFDGATRALIFSQILSEAPESPLKLNPGLPPALPEIISKALEKDRGLRYQTAADLKADLKKAGAEIVSALEGHPQEPAVMNAVKSAPLRLRRWHLIAASVLVAIVSAAVAGITWFLKGSHQPRAELVERQITANPPEAKVSGAAISPDGKHIAYNDQTGLYLRSVDSGETHAVSLPEGFHNQLSLLEWFPDSTQLLAEASASEHDDIWVITIQGEAEPHLLYSNGLDPAISPDGRMIAFVRTEPTVAVWVTGIIGAAPRKLAGDQQWIQMVSPAWSPDGRWIAYVSWTKTAPGSWSSAIEVTPTAGGAAKTVVAESSLPKSSSLCYVQVSAAPCLSWSPDWRLVFSARRPDESRPGKDSYSLWDIPIKPGTSVVAGKPERLVEWRDFYPTDLSVTSDGKRLSFLKNRIWDDVYLGGLGTDGATMEAPRRLTLDDRGIRSLDSWTPDSQAILFSSDRNGRAEVFKQRLKESVAETLVQGPQDDYNSVFSPDQSWLLYTESTPTAVNAPASPQRLMRRLAAGGSPEVVLQDPGGELSAHWWSYRCPRQPGSSCVDGEKNGNEVVFYSLDPVRGKGEQLGEIEADISMSSGWNVSPDGSRLALIDGDEHKARIEVLTFRDHAWHQVPVDLQQGTLQSIAWAADGSGFFSDCWGLPDGFNLLRIALNGKVKPLLSENRRQPLMNPLPSPDGKYLAFDAETWDSNVWVLENF